jgi:hypothetical protein
LATSFLLPSLVVSANPAECVRAHLVQRQCHDVAGTNSEVVDSVRVTGESGERDNWARQVPEVGSFLRDEVTPRTAGLTKMLTKGKLVLILFPK